MAIQFVISLKLKTCIARLFRSYLLESAGLEKYPRPYMWQWSSYFESMHDPLLRMLQRVRETTFKSTPLQFTLKWKGSDTV